MWCRFYAETEFWWLHQTYAMTEIWASDILKRRSLKIPQVIIFQSPRHRASFFFFFFFFSWIQWINSISLGSYNPQVCLIIAGIIVGKWANFSHWSNDAFSKQIYDRCRYSGRTRPLYHWIQILERSGPVWELSGHKRSTRALLGIPVCFHNSVINEVDYSQSFHTFFYFLVRAALNQAAFSTVGTEIAAFAAAEARDPKRSLPHAIRGVMFRILVLYILGTFVIGLLVRSSDPRLSLKERDASSSPFVISFTSSVTKVLPS